MWMGVERSWKTNLTDCLLFSSFLTTTGPPSHALASGSVRIAAPSRTGDPDRCGRPGRLGVSVQRVASRRLVYSGDIQDPPMGSMACANHDIWLLSIAIFKALFSRELAGVLGFDPFCRATVPA